MVPAIGLGAERPEAGLMQLPPRSQKEPLLNARLLAKALLWYGLIESVASMSAYFFMNWLHGWPGVPLAAAGTLTYRMATTMTLAGVVVTQVGAVMACRTDLASVFRIGFFTIAWSYGDRGGTDCWDSHLCAIYAADLQHCTIGPREWIYLCWTR
jgi:magnesium-transporting ATPase (P-type)